MSFILDALKKSENDRQRQSGPAVFEMKVASRKPGLPGWAWGLSGLLAINLGVVAWLMLRHPSRADAQAVQAAPAPVIPAAAAPAAAPARAVIPPPRATVAPPAAIASEEANPEDYEPATEPAATPPSTNTASSVGLPDYTQIAGTAAVKGMPDLRLDLHVYAIKPAERFVFINMHRLHEGESLPEGVRVESITNDGAILSWRGAKFVLDRE